MDISAIMNINELAASRRVKARTDLPAKIKEEGRKLNNAQTAHRVADEKDVIEIEVKNRIQQTDAEKETPVNEFVNGGIVNIRT